MAPQAVERQRSAPQSGAWAGLTNRRPRPSPAPRLAPYSPHAPAPKTGRPTRAKASRPDLQPLDEHLAALLNPALVEPKPHGFGEAPQQNFESPAPESHPRGLTGATATVELLKDPARARRPQHPRPAAVDAAPAAAAGQVGGRATVPRRLGIRARGRPAAGDRGAGQGRRRRTSATRCCSASPARARPSPWPR